MHRRTFVRLLAAAASAKAAIRLDAQQRALPIEAQSGLKTGDLPKLRAVTSHAPSATPGMPAPYPGRVISVKSDASVDVATGAANAEVVRDMMGRGMRALTGASSTADAWKRFFVPADVVGIKVNCGGYPHCVSAYEIVAEVVQQLVGVGIPIP